MRSRFFALEIGRAALSVADIMRFMSERATSTSGHLSKANHPSGAVGALSADFCAKAASKAGGAGRLSSVISEPSARAVFRAAYGMPFRGFQLFRPAPPRGSVLVGKSVFIGRLFGEGNPSACSFCSLCSFSFLRKSDRAPLFQIFGRILFAAGPAPPFFRAAARHKATQRSFQAPPACLKRFSSFAALQKGRREFANPLHGKAVGGVHIPNKLLFRANYKLGGILTDFAIIRFLK